MKLQVILELNNNKLVGIINIYKLYRSLFY